MLFSKKTEYALQALIALTFAHQVHEGKSLTIKNMAETEKIPYKFLEQIMAVLKKGGVVTSQKGQNGGYVLSRLPEEVTVGDIVSLMEGPLAVRGPAKIMADKEAIYRVFAEVQEAIGSILHRSTLEQLYSVTRELSERRRVSEMYYI